MPRSPRFTKDEAGKPYIWEAGEHFSISRVTEKVRFFSMDFYKAFGKDVQNRQKRMVEENHISDTCEMEDQDILDDGGRLDRVFSEYHGYNGSGKMTRGSMTNT